MQGQRGEETLDNRGISEQDIEKMTDEAEKTVSKTPQTEEEKKLMEEWEQHMSDFVPEDISTIVVDPRKEVVSAHFQKPKITVQGINKFIKCLKHVFEYRLSMRMWEQTQCTSEGRTLWASQPPPTS